MWARRHAPLSHALSRRHSLMAFHGPACQNILSQLTACSGGSPLPAAPVMPGPTDVARPDYYHKVVDCQWACPAHTNVPEYLRLIAQGRYTESYLLNRESNVFPGILGRTCDRPCEPACRRGRVDGTPVAICRLKRVAADLRDDVTEYLPKAPDIRNGKRVALVGAGPASLTVANDLMPL